MLYHFYLFLFTNFSIEKFFGTIVLLALVVGIVRTGGAGLFRYTLIPLVPVEAYLMSPGYACSHGGFFKRADAMSGMCQGAPYNAYLNKNFGMDLWYIYALYAGIFLFAIWPIISRIYWDLKGEAFEDASYMKQAELQREESERISRVKQIGPM